jgi:hypothetical protein
MNFPIKQGDNGHDVISLQQQLIARGYGADPNGSFDNKTFDMVRVFQAENLDQNGQPLVVDGAVGPITWWSLTHPKPVIVVPAAVNFTVDPPQEAGGSAIGRAALHAAIGELAAGAGEIGGNNRGPWVAKYLAPAKLPEGNSWCASFVSWCYLQTKGGDQTAMPIAYCPAARGLLEELKNKGWQKTPESAYQPLPGDIVVWWRESADGWLGHTGLVYQLTEGYLYTIEGNRSPNVQGFLYVLSRMTQLLGFGHIPDA